MQQSASNTVLAATDDMSASPVVKRLETNHAHEILYRSIHKKPSTQVSLVDAHLVLPRDWSPIRIPPVTRPILPTPEEIKTYGFVPDEVPQSGLDTELLQTHEATPLARTEEDKVYNMEARRFLRDMMRPNSAFAMHRDAIMLQMEHVLDCVGDDPTKFIEARRQLETTLRLGEKCPLYCWL